MIVREVIDGKVIERELTQEEINEMNKLMTPQDPALEERVSAIEEVILNLL